MSNSIITLTPESLSGPRSFFTDLDRIDPDYHQKNIERKLKIQLLTKEKIIIAASSLFHDIGYDLFKEDDGLSKALESGIILPAIRNTFDGVEDFFVKKSYPNYSKSFFSSHVTHYVPWDLEENTSWFKTKLYQGIENENSILRKQINFSKNDAIELINKLNEEYLSKGDAYLSREHITSVSVNLDKKTANYLNSYANLIYRISGARVVNSEGHFPQSNLTRLWITESDSLISDESIFWDIYVEGVISFLNSAVRLTPERIDQLNFLDILNIRQSLFDIEFSKKFDELITTVKQEISADDPDKIIFKQEEILELANNLKNSFSQRIQTELSYQNRQPEENSLWQVANVLSLLAAPQANLIVGCLSALKSIPEITAYFSKPLADSMNLRVEWVRNFVNTKIGWTAKQKATFLKGYKKLVMYGLDDI